MNELRLHLDECAGPFVDAKDCPVHRPKPNGLYLTIDEIRSLYRWMEREFVPHNEDYEINQNLMKKFHDKLAG